MTGITFWKKIFVFILCLILLDFLVGKALEHFYFTQKSGKLHNVTIALEQQTCEVLIFGSSRAMHHYDPEIITDTLGLSCYNIGYDGQSIMYCNGVLDVILERYTPKMIVLDINPMDFEETAGAYDLLYVLNPYAKRHPVLWNTLSLKTTAEKIKHLSSIYPYNSMILRIAAGNIPGKRKDTSDNGFTAQEGTWPDIAKSEFYPAVTLDMNKIDAFNSFCLKCSENNIKLYVVVSPMYKLVENTSSTIDYLIQKCSTSNILFIDYTSVNKYANNAYFLDPDHLNVIGSNLFSKDIAHKISLSLSD